MCIYIYYTVYMYIYIYVWASVNFDHEPSKQTLGHFDHFGPSFQLRGLRVKIEIPKMQSKILKMGGCPNRNGGVLPKKWPTFSVTSKPRVWRNMARPGSRWWQRLVDQRRLVAGGTLRWGGGEAAPKVQRSNRGFPKMGQNILSACYIYIYGGFHSDESTPIAGWFTMENPIKMDDLGVLFQETSKW